MAKEEDDVALIDGEQQDDENAEGSVGEVDAGAEQQGAQDADDAEVVVTIGDAEPEKDEPAPAWVKDLRKRARELEEEKRALEEKLRAATAKPEAAGKKPALEDFDYDADKFETALTAWHDKRRAESDKAMQERAKEEEASKAWQDQLNAYGTAKAALKVKDFEAAEFAVQSALSQTQQGVIVAGVQNPALVVYALGKNPAKLKEFAAITDPVRFAVAIGQLTKDIQMRPKKEIPPPETTISGTGAKSGAVDSQLERLRTEAEKTGDYTKVMRYKREKQRKAA